MKKKNEDLSIFSNEDGDKSLEDDEEDGSVEEESEDVSMRSMKDQFVDELRGDSKADKRPKIPVQKSVCRAHGKQITRLCISSPCGALQAGACDDCIKQFHNHKVGRYLRVSTFEEEFQTCLYSKGKSDFYQRKLKLVEYVREYLRRFAAKVYDVFDQTSKNIEKMVGNKQFFQMLRTTPQELLVADQLKAKNYENVPNVHLVSIYHKMEDFERSGELMREAQNFKENLNYLKDNLLQLIDQTKRYIKLPIFEEFYTPYNFDEFRISNPIISMCELTGVVFESEDKQLLEKTKSLEAYGIAKDSIRLKNYDKAVRSLNELIVFNPRMGQLYHMKADCLSNLKGNELNAIKNYNVAQKLTPANVNLTLDKCWLLLRLRKLDEVEVELKSKIPPDQYNEKAFFILGEYYSLKQDYKKAIECYDKAIALNNRNQETFLRKGICLSRLQRVEEALKMLNFCIQLDPSQDEAFYERGLIDMNQGELGGAAFSFQQAIQLNPNKRVYYDKLFAAYQKLGRTKEVETIKQTEKYQTSF